MTTLLIRPIKRIVFIFILIAALSLQISAQVIKASSFPSSMVSVASSQNKTNIRVSGFPKKTTVVIFDSGDNLLAVVSTNKFGAAHIVLHETVKNIVYVKTLNGEILVSNMRPEENESPRKMALKPAGKRIVV